MTRALVGLRTPYWSRQNSAPWPVAGRAGPQCDDARYPRRPTRHAVAPGADPGLRGSAGDHSSRAAARNGARAAIAVFAQGGGQRRNPAARASGAGR